MLTFQSTSTFKLILSILLSSIYKKNISKLPSGKKQQQHTFKRYVHFCHIESDSIIPKSYMKVYTLTTVCLLFLIHTLYSLIKQSVD